MCCVCVRMVRVCHVHMLRVRVRVLHVHMLRVRVLHALRVHVLRVHVLRVHVRGPAPRWTACFCLLSPLAFGLARGLRLPGAGACVAAGGAEGASPGPWVISYFPSSLEIIANDPSRLKNACIFH